jgi:hypothetical protein
MEAVFGIRYSDGRARRLLGYFVIELFRKCNAVRIRIHPKLPVGVILLISNRKPLLAVMREEVMREEVMREEVMRL